MNIETQDRWKEIRSIQKKYVYFYKLLGSFIFVLFGIWIGSVIFVGEEGYATNIYTEIISIFVTVLILDQLNDYRDTSNLQKRLVNEAGGQSNESAKQAVDWMRREGWLTDEDSLLINAHLFGANLEKAHLYGANLANAQMTQAKLKQARLNGSNLINVNLYNADMRGIIAAGAKFQDGNLGMINGENAIFNNADLTGADLRNANLRNAEFSFGCLYGTDLRGADLTGAILFDSAFVMDVEVKNYMLNKLFNNKTILPDGKHWSPEIDIMLYINDNHPNYWKRKIYNMWNWPDPIDERGFFISEPKLIRETDRILKKNQLDFPQMTVD